MPKGMEIFERYIFERKKEKGKSKESKQSKENRKMKWESEAEEEAGV